MAGKIIADIIEAPYDAIRMNVANVTVLTANSSGLTFVPTGNVNVTIGGANANLTMNILTANGIKFPATQVPSADGNTLDDYEEGTFTPILNASGSSPTVTYTARYGHYTKIGRMVYISLRIVVNTVSGGSGAVVVGGLPFSATTAGVGTQHNLGGTFSLGLAWGGSTTQLSPWVPGDTSTVQFRGLQNNASNQDTEISGVSAGDYLDAQGWYFV